MGSKKKESAFDGDHEIQQGRPARLLELALHSVIDHLLYIRATTAASKAGTRRAHDITRRAGAVSDEAANLSIGDSMAMANEHRISLSGFMRTSAFYFYRK